MVEESLNREATFLIHCNAYCLSIKRILYFKLDITKAHLVSPKIPVIRLHR